MFDRRLLPPLVALLAMQVSAHGGHEGVPEGEAVSQEPIVSLLEERDWFSSNEGILSS